MAFVTDPDNLDRYQVCVNAIAETISIRGLGTNVSSASNDGTTNGTTTFEAASADFVTDAVAPGDILTLVSGSGAGHYVVASVSDLNTLIVETTIPGSATNISWRIDNPEATGQVGEAVADGVTLQAVYSFLKEEWRTFSMGGTNAPDLIQFIFPIESITREQFEIGGPTHSNWDWADITTRNLIRTGGWAQIDSDGTTQTEYAGIITLGSLDTDAQVYYQQTDALAAPDNFVLTGAVNQAILTYTNGGDDDRSYLKLFVRKKARSYAQSEIADIGVTTIETIVNRFPLTHVVDPAITTYDGLLAGSADATATVFGTTTAVATSVTSGAGEGITDATATDGLFEFQDAGALFTTTNEVAPGDVITFESGALTGNTYEIQAVSDGSTLILYQEPGEVVADETAVTYSTRTRYIVFPGTTDGVIADATASDGIGELTSATVGDFAAAGVAAGDYLKITEGGTAGATVIGVYKIDSVVTSTVFVDIGDNENWATGTGIDFEILEPGMFLQYKSVAATLITASGGRTFTFDSTGDTITLSSGDLLADGYVEGGTVTVFGTTSNNGTYVIDTVTATVITVIGSLTDEGPLSATATLNGEEPFVRTLNQQEYPFNWRLFGNGCTLNQAFEWIQKELRQSYDIDEGNGTARGDVTDLLMTFAAPSGSGLNMFIDDLSSADFNNATFFDTTDTARNFAFIAGVTITLNANITGSSNSKVVVFFTNNDTGDNDGADFGTPNAIIVQDSTGGDMTAVNPASNLSFTFDYDNNTQRGTGSNGTDAPVTIVAIGTDTAQYVLTTGSILRQNNNTFALVAALERNYANP